VDLHPDFRDLLSQFAASSVDYLMIGGWAVSFHSEPRYTKDLDLLLVGSDDNLARAAEALGAFGAPRSVIDLLLALGPEEFMAFGTPPTRVDIHRSIPGIDIGAAFSRAVVADWRGTPVRVLSREDLIASKRAAGRPRDLQDVLALERART